MTTMKLLSGRWYGDTLNKDSVAGLTLTETSYESNLKLPRHSHEQAYFCLVLKGAYTESFRKQTRTCKKATMIFHPADESHADHFHTESRCFNIQISDRWMDRVRQHPLSLHEPRDFAGGMVPCLAMRLYVEFRRADELSPLVMEGIALEIMGEASRRPPVKSHQAAPSWLAEARDILHEQFYRRLTVSELSHFVDVHPVHLAREFRRFYHCTIGDYVRQRRIEFACKQLVQSDAPLSDIALSGGFFDQSHFTKTFKQHTGRTPQEYRTAFQPR